MAENQIMPRWYGCSGCTGYCDTGCYTGCDGCTGYCEGYCSGCSGCSGSCTGCSGACKSSCKGTCGQTCSSSCNSTCKSGTQATNLTKLDSINETLKASDMTNLITAVNFEVVNRRSGTVTSVTISAGESVDDAKIATIIANIKKASQTPSQSATAGATVNKTLINDLIAKVKAANNETIKLGTIT